MVSCRVKFNLVKQHRMLLIAAENVCLACQKNYETSPVRVDDLFEPSNIIRLSKNALGVWIPANEILSRTKYNWFCSVSVENIKKGDYLLADMFRMAHDYGNNKDDY
jgi:hypothetical protein